MDHYGDSRLSHLGELVLATHGGRNYKTLQRAMATRVWGDVLALQYVESVDEVPVVVVGLSGDGDAYDAVIGDDIRVSLRVYSTTTYGGAITIRDSTSESRSIRDWIDRCSDWGITPLTLLCQVNPYSDIELGGDRIAFMRPKESLVSGLRAADWHRILEGDLKGDGKDDRPQKKTPDRLATLSRLRIPVTCGIDITKLFLEVEEANG